MAILADRTNRRLVPVLGICVSLGGVPYVRDVASHAGAAMHSTARKFGRILRRWLTRARESVRSWWDRARGRGSGGSRVETAAPTRAGAQLEVTVNVLPVDRERIPVREWLGVLDDRVEYLLAARQEMEQRRVEDNADVRERLVKLEREMHRELHAALRAGWELIVTGLALSAVGSVLSLAGSY